MSYSYIPPQNFGTTCVNVAWRIMVTGACEAGLVAENLYRSGEPNELNLPFLERLRLKTIIYLAPDEPSRLLSAVICAVMHAHASHCYVPPG